MGGNPPGTVMETHRHAVWGNYFRKNMDPILKTWFYIPPANIKRPFLEPTNFNSTQKEAQKIKIKFKKQRINLQRKSKGL